MTASSYCFSAEIPLLVSFKDQRIKKLKGVRLGNCSCGIFFGVFLRKLKILHLYFRFEILCHHVFDNSKQESVIWPLILAVLSSSVLNRSTVVLAHFRIFLCAGVYLNAFLKCNNVGTFQIQYWVTLRKKQNKTNKKTPQTNRSFVSQVSWSCNMQDSRLKLWRMVYR